MEIGVTIPLQKFLGWRRPPYGDEPRLLFCWDAHRADVNGRKLLVVVNAANRFAAIRRMDGADWGRLDAVVSKVVSEAVAGLQVPDQARRRYFDAAGALVFTKTHGRKPVAGLNRVVDDIWHSVPQHVDEDALFQRRLSAIANETICRCATREGYVRPREAFLEDLEALASEGGFAGRFEERGSERGDGERFAAARSTRAAGSSVPTAWKE